MTNKVKSKAADGAAGLNVSPDRRELHFLEKNLEELSRAHKKVPMREENNLVLSCGIFHWEKNYHALC